jgi:hypothetical protein
MPDQPHRLREFTRVERPSIKVPGPSSRDRLLQLCCESIVILPYTWPVFRRAMNKTCPIIDRYYRITMPTLTFKVSSDEARRLRNLAKKQNVTLSELLRKKTLSEDSSHLGVRRVRCRETGAQIFASAPGSKPLTTASVRELLADFP